MNSIPLRTVIRMLHVAMGYGSRTERITRLINSSVPDVAITARSLQAMGYLRPEIGTIDLDPARHEGL